MFKRVKFYALLCIIVASTFIGLFSFSRTAGAQDAATNSDGLWIDQLVLDDANVVTYGYAVSWCLEGTSTDVAQDANRNKETGVSQTDLTKGEWFKNIKGSTMYKNPIYVGYGAVKNKDGKLECKDISGTYFAQIGGWGGAGSEITAACDLWWRMEGHGKDDATQCKDIKTENAGNKYHSKLERDRGGKDGIFAVLPRGGNKTGGGPGYNNVQLYALYATALTKACGATAHGLVEGNTSANSGNWTVVTVVDQKGVPHDAYYEIPGKMASTSVPVAYGIGAKCKDLPDLMKATSGEYGKWLTDNGSTGPATIVGADHNSTCQITGVGWIVCPVMTFLGDATDATYGILDKVFLRLEPVNMDLSSDKNGVYRSWKMMRDTANIVFVVAFLIIVFSQITGMGVSNYGLKRLVPKLIMAAILVNISYFICAIAVDLSNILGSALKSLLDGASDGILTKNSETAWNSWGSDGTGGGVFRHLVAQAILIGAGTALAVWATLPLLGAGILIVLPIIIAVLVTMIVRQALVVLLIVISPLAFVALLLPNTETYFKKWQETFKAMLLIYPVVALVFGAAALASTVLMAAAQASDGDNTIKALDGIAAALIKILPLVFIPALMKISSGVFGRLTGIVNDKHKGWFDNARNNRMNNHKFNMAKRNERIGNPNNTNFLQRRSVLGGPNSKRRRVLGRLTPYGSNLSSREMKDRVAQTESMDQAAYLGSERGTNANNNAKNAQINLQNAQLRADSVRLDGLSNDFLMETQTAKRQQHTAENKADARGLDALRTAAAGQVVLEQEKNSELTKEIAENRVATAATQRASHVLEGLVQETGKDKKAAEDTATAQGLSRVSGAALARSENSKNELQAAENTAAAIGSTLADRITAARTEETALEKQTAENLLARDTAPLVSQAARVAAKDADIKKQTSVSQAETNADSIFNSSASGQTTLAESENAKNAKQIESDNSQAIGIALADKDLKVRAATSSEALSGIQGQDKQLYEEIIAGKTPPGVNPTTIADAQATREAATVTREATARAQGVSADALSNKVLSDPVLAAQMGGMDPNGPLAARTRAANSLTQSHSEAVNNYLSLLRRERRTGTDSMGRLPTLNGAEMEANAVNVAKYGADEDIIALLDYAGRLPAGDARKISILQQYADNVGNRNPPAIGQEAFESIRNGKWVGNIASSWRERTKTGSFSGTKAAAMSKALLKSQYDALNTTTLTTAERAGLEKYVDSIIEYRNDKLIKQPEAKITEEMDRIVRLIHPTWTADPRP